MRAASLDKHGLKCLGNLVTPEYCTEPWRIFPRSCCASSLEGPCGIEPKEKLRPCTLGLQRLEGSFFEPFGVLEAAGRGEGGAHTPLG